MKIQFDPDQEYQREAREAVLDLFEGQPLATGAFEVRFDAMAGELVTELGVGNQLLLADDALLTNLRTVQARNGLPESTALAGRHFSVEMETGTGKTYVYLRTLYDLHARYGFKKFIVVVPSVAIREGVLKNIALTREHFQSLYGNVPLDAWIYDSRQVSRLRQFAASNAMQLLIINIDAFNKQDLSVIHRDNDRLSGRRPIEFIQAAQPIVVVDEPQNMETVAARAAIDALNPLLTLRYSATHRDPYNLVYRLDPVRAYDLRLVKRIEVDSVVDGADFNRPFLRVVSITPAKGKITAKVELDVAGASGPRRKAVNVTKNGTDFYDLSGEREQYRGYIVDHLDASNRYVAFTNGVRLYEGQSQGSNQDEVMRVQVRETVKEHFEKELAISRLPAGERLKVLSLFFIDRVANYAAADGRIRRWFEEAYQECAARDYYAPLNPLPVEQVHNGYFAQDRNGAKDTSGATKADDDAYQLIMRDKERLLSLDEPLRFIFSHSALREGWDNPNVFQICTLNETRSELKKRQEIGRGLRLPVRESGLRSFDPNVNRLTVIANESYHSFARQLQTEIEEDFGVQFEGRIMNKRERRRAVLKKGWRIDADFMALWERIKPKTRYAVAFDTETLIQLAARGLKSQPPIEPPRFQVAKVELLIGERGVTAEARAAYNAASADYSAPIPDLLGYLQRETELTRATLAQILIRSGRLGEVARNPQQFLDQARGCIRATLHELMVDGIKYERIAGAEYKMLLFEEKEIEGYLSRMLEVGKSIYDAIEFDSDVERRFAETLNQREDIRLFVKLPAWFKVETPLGTYNPDWAIVKHHDTTLYLVRETKGTTEALKLRTGENEKIRCGAAHFAALGVDYRPVASANDV